MMVISRWMHGEISDDLMIYEQMHGETGDDLVIYGRMHGETGDDGDFQMDAWTDQ